MGAGRLGGEGGWGRGGGVISPKTSVFGYEELAELVPHLLDLVGEFAPAGV